MIGEHAFRSTAFDATWRAHVQDLRDRGEPLDVEDCPRLRGQPERNLRAYYIQRRVIRPAGEGGAS